MEKRKKVRLEIIEKHYDKIFWGMIIVAGCLTFVTTDRLENRLNNMEIKIENMNTMIKEMSE